MPEENRAARRFVVLWWIVTLAKVVVAARLPLFVDEAFYWQEGRHLAVAYSDLPGLTAWLIRIGTEIGGQHVLAVRAPFLLLAALLPWLVGHIAARWFDQELGWHAAALTLLMPLSGTLGLLALPDVLMAFAAVLCMDAVARMLREVEAASVLQLAAGLAVGALSHYRFVGVIAVGFVALLCLRPGRVLLRDPRVWIALAFGLVAWAPLLAWNLQNADAGLRFQLVDRHPWTFQWGGWLFLPLQALLVTPLLALALVQAALRLGRPDEAVPPQWRYFALLGAFSTVGYFVLGFFADVERVSFHWPLQGYLALLVVVPWCLRRWGRGWQRATWAVCVAGLVAMLGYYSVVSVPRLREELAATKTYPYNFAGWAPLAVAVREELARMPAGTTLLADSFKSGAELGFAMDDPDIPVLDHPLNRKHGRAPQLELWGLHSDGTRGGPQLLVVATGDVPYKFLLQHYHSLCRRVGPLPPPRTVQVDHGHQRFLLFRLPATRTPGACTTPAMAWIDVPLPDAAVAAVFDVRGWAFKDGAGLKSVEVLVDGRPAATATYGLPAPGVAEYWRISNDPTHPDVGFRARVDVAALRPGRHWLGLRLHGTDGSVEEWPEQPFRVR